MHNAAHALVRVRLGPRLGQQLTRKSSDRLMERHVRLVEIFLNDNL